MAASQAGFAAPAGEGRRSGVGGLALVGTDGKVIAASFAMAPLEGAFGEFVRAAPSGARALYDLHAGLDGAPAVGFLVPVFGLQAAAGTPVQVATLAALRDASPLFALLPPPTRCCATCATICRPAPS